MKGIIQYGNTVYTIDGEKITGKEVAESYFPALRYTSTGAKKVNRYLQKMAEQRKEVLESGEDTALSTVLPDKEDILNDASSWGFDEEGIYWNGWGITDNISATPIELRYGLDIVPAI